MNSQILMLCGCKEDQETCLAEKNLESDGMPCACGIYTSFSENLGFYECKVSA